MSRPRKNIPQRRYRARPPLTVMQLPLTAPELQRLQAHMRRHGALGLTPRQIGYALKKYHIEMKRF